MELKYIVKRNNNLSIDNILNNEFNISSRLRQKLINNNIIKLNGENCDTRQILKLNDIVSICFNYDEDNSNIVPTKMNLNILYEDEWLLIVNKPAGFAIHPSILHHENSISNGIKHYFDEIGLKKKIRPVNRLDLNTSGLVIFAKCEYIQECLSVQMSKNEFKKDYLAFVNGLFNKSKGTINLPIARKNNSIIERCINENGQISITHYEVLKNIKNYSLVKCTLETGRTHQIRVHMSAIRSSSTSEMIYMVCLLILFLGMLYIVVI